MKVKESVVIDAAVNIGVRRGLAEANNTDFTFEQMAELISDKVLEEISDWFEVGFPEHEVSAQMELDL